MKSAKFHGLILWKSEDLSVGKFTITFHFKEKERNQYHEGYTCFSEYAGNGE